MAITKISAYSLGLFVVGLAANATIAVGAPAAKASQPFVTQSSSAWGSLSGEGLTSQAALNASDVASSGLTVNVDATMQAFAGLSLIANAAPSNLSALASDMGMSSADINTLYVAALSVRSVYDQQSRQAISSWCNSFSQQNFTDAVSAADIAAYQESLRAIDSVVMSAVSGELNKLSASSPQAYGALLDSAQTFNLQGVAVDQSAAAPADWVKNHTAACMGFGS